MPRGIRPYSVWLRTGPVTDAEPVGTQPEAFRKEIFGSPSHWGLLNWERGTEAVEDLCPHVVCPQEAWCRKELASSVWCAQSTWIQLCLKGPVQACAGCWQSPLQPRQLLAFAVPVKMSVTGMWFTGQAASPAASSPICVTLLGTTLTKPPGKRDEAWQLRALTEGLPCQFQKPQTVN